ncbi:hypothetical protein JTB14_003023 [Gonioctena quinquepunctata]|nr:hypothetical protein JTB14_003023 [Gonioctena quinquepunctata]
MSIARNFRVIVNLSNFFSDHRHRARVFVSENIQTIQDLQDKISRIFQIQSFHLTSQNEFLPPSEDVRILQNDELLWATPYRISEVNEATAAVQSPQKLNSTGVILKLSTSNLTKKRKNSEPAEDEVPEIVDIGTNGTIIVPNYLKERKKSKLMIENASEIEKCEGDSLRATSKKKKKKKKSHKSREKISLMDVSEDVAVNNETEKPENSETFYSTSPRVCLGQAIRSSPLTYKKQLLVPTITDQYLKEKKINVVEINVISEATCVTENGTQEIQEEKQELPENGPSYVTKGIPPVLPVAEKKSPESSISQKDTSSDEKMSCFSTSLEKFRQKILNNTSNCVSAPEAGLKPQKYRQKPVFKSPDWTRPTSIPSRDQTVEEPRKPPVLKIFNTPKCHKEKLADQVVTSSAEVQAITDQKTEDTVEVPEDVVRVQNVVSGLDESPKTSQAEVVPVDSSYLELSSIGPVESLQASFDMSVNGTGAVTKTGKESFGFSGVHRIYSPRNSTSFKQIAGVGALLDGLRTAKSSPSFDSTLETDTSDFVTQRVKRKRHRKHKKNPKDTSDSCARITETYVPRPMNVQGAPSIHIKFSEDGDVEEGNSLEESEVSESIGICTLNASSTIMIESESDEIRVKEGDILRSPLMTSLVPKTGDVIAFRVLKLAEDYKPEMSSYITGKVTNFNSDSNTVNFEILGGLDQCQEPRGKFSMDIDEFPESQSRDREFIWTDLVEPRLLFP